ncbi:MAG: hypothetical protein NXH85_08270 [Pseudomonadaceae bacterium]|nr:hypothetical protein [Pseudomonadaceae bacterium]
MKAEPTKNLPEAMCSPRRVAAAAIVAAVLLTSVSAQAARFYRYTNATGATEISSSIPSDRVAYGYQIIDGTSGRVLQTVAAQLSPEQARLKAIQDEKLARCEAAVDRVHTLYQSEAEIVAAEQQTIESIDVRIVNARANITQLQTQLTELEGQAARAERSGRPLTAAMVESIESAREQIDQLEQEVAARRAEQDNARVAFEQEMALFRDPDCKKLVSQR